MHSGNFVNPEGANSCLNSDMQVNVNVNVEQDYVFFRVLNNQFFSKNATFYRKWQPFF